MTGHFDELETRSREAREADLARALPEQIARAKASASSLGKLLADVAPDTVTGRDALAKLPVIRKAGLVEAQRAAPPFGGYAALG